MTSSNTNQTPSDLSLILPLTKVPRAPARPVRVIGIDLGTTNSTVTELTYVPGEDPPKARCIEVEQPTRQGIYIHHLVPSVVALHQGTVYIGEGAKRLRAQAGDPKSELRRNRSIFWDCKNDMGLKRTYHQAPEGYRSAPDIASQVLRYLRDAAALLDGPPVERIVVTVPASFNAAQRQDTLKAAQTAGFAVEEGDFLDEPVAAFLNYLANPEVRGILTPGKEQNLLVFDFGGGTCDVAVLRLCLSRDGNQFAISPLAVSRYHRLGGGDIDAAILHEALIPQIREQNDLAPFDLDFEIRKHQIEPALLSIAETLKIGLCTDIRRLRAFQKYDPDKRESVVKKVPGVNTVPLKDGRVLRLESPTLNAQQFEEILEPFLDTALLFHRETEYRMTCSIFAPLKDALDSAQLDEDQVDLCLLVGGSCLIPQVVDTVEKFFPRARVLSHESEDDIQTAVARGAAYHALSLALFGQGLVEPVVGDSVYIRTSSGPMELIPRGAPLPYPGDAQWAVNRSLQVPETSLGKPLELHVELLNGQGHSLMNKKWTLQPGIQRGNPLILEFRMDRNQKLSFRLEVEKRPEQRPLERECENPFSNAVHPNERIVRIEELEEEIRTKSLCKNEKEGKVLEIAKHCAELGQRDKAMTLMIKVLQSRGPDAELLNRLGMLAGEMGDTEREIKFYREAAKESNWSAPLFNLALTYKRQKRYKDAQEALDEALDRDPDGPYWILKAQLFELQKQPREKDEALQEAFAMMGTLKQMNEWELGWYEYAAHLAEKTDMASDIQKELNTRKKKGLAPSTGEPILPEIRSAIQRRED